MHLQIESDVGTGDLEGYVRRDAQRLVHRAVRGLHTQRMLGVVHEVQVIAEVLADRDDLTARVQDTLDGILRPVDLLLRS